MRFGPWLVCALVALFAVPALAAGKAEETVTDGAVRVYDDGYSDIADGDTTVNVTAGGKVTFGYPAGGSTHDVEFDAGSEPSSCEPALPPGPEGPGWQSTCTFAGAGTYNFFCGAHPGMRGTVNVAPGGPTPSPSPSASPSASPSPSPSPSASPSPSPSPSPSASPSPSPAPGPAVAARFEGRDYSATDVRWQDAATGADTVTVQPGDRVAFAYPSGTQYHNANFKSALKPVACLLTRTNTARETDGASPFPDSVAKSEWEGSCRFDAAGTYTFVCDAHPQMVGKVIVAAPEQAAPPASTPTAVAAAAATQVAAPPASTVKPVVRRAAKPTLAATFTRKKRTVTFTGSLAAKTGKVKLALNYLAGKKKVKKSVSAKIVKGRFSAKIKLSAADARKAKKLSATLTYAGDAAFAPATKKATPKVKK